MHENQHQPRDPGHHEVFPDTEPQPTARPPWGWIISGIVVGLLLLLVFGHHLGLPIPIEKLHRGGH